MSQVVTQNKRKIKIQSIDFSRYVGSLRVKCLWEDFLKENINVTDNEIFLCPVNLNYVFKNVHTRIHLYNLLISFKIYRYLISFGIALIISEDLRNVLKLSSGALAGVAQWIELWSENQRVIGSIPSQGTCLGCRTGSLVWGAQEATTHRYFSPSLSPSLRLCLKTNK